MVSDPSVPVVANIDATPKHTSQDGIDALIRQVCAPVRWEDVVRRLIADGVTTFVEVGPGRVLTGLVRKIDRSVRITNVEDEESLLSAESALGAETE